jgi:hypothetical protein
MGADTWQRPELVPAWAELALPVRALAALIDAIHRSALGNWVRSGGATDRLETGSRRRQLGRSMQSPIAE